MTIYKRTEKGQIFLYDKKSTTSRKIRSILRVVDGKTESRVYIENLQAFGDVGRILSELEALGLIRSTGSTKEDDEIGYSPTLVVPEYPEKENAAQSSESTLKHANINSRSINNTADSSTLSDKREISKDTRDSEYKAALKMTLNEMSDFVLLNVPQHSYNVLKELESIDSFESLSTIMAGYAQMIENCDGDFSGHLKKISFSVHKHT